MTRKEQTGVRDLSFSGWVRENLPDSSTGFLVSDLDFILWNWKQKKLMLVEVKTRKGKMRLWQSKLFEVLDKIIRKGIDHIEDQIDYKGFHCIRFENTCFNDGRCLLDNKLVTEEQLINILSMK